MTRSASLDDASRLRSTLARDERRDKRSAHLERLSSLSRQPVERRSEVWDILRAVPDPEIPAVSIVDLGIVREADTNGVLLTPTYTGCPATQVIETMVRIALDDAGFDSVRIETTLSPPWSTDWITPEGREKLRAYGIAPPIPAGTKAVHCPQCDSADTAEISRFGSTPCKALWRCRACLEPFDLFKCH